MIEKWIAAKMVDKLCARNLIIRRINSVERDMMINDIQQTYAEYDQRILYEVFVEWINQGHGIPQPADLIPRIKEIMRQQQTRKLTELTPEQIAELRELCHRYGENRRAWLDYAAEGDPAAEGRPDATPKILGPYDVFYKRVESALAE